MDKWKVYAIYRGDKDMLLSMREAETHMDALRQTVSSDLEKLKETDVLMSIDEETGERRYREPKMAWCWPDAYCEEDQPRWAVEPATEAEFEAWKKEEQEWERGNEAMLRENMNRILAASRSPDQPKYSDYLLALWSKQVDEVGDDVRVAADALISRYEQQVKEGKEYDQEHE